MLEKLRAFYEKHLTVKIITVVFVVILSVAVLLPVLKLAKFFGVDLQGHSGVNLIVDLPNAFFFFLFGSCTITIIWVAQKYIHKKSILELGFRSKLVKLFLFGFMLGAIKELARYTLLYLNSAGIEFISVIPDDISILKYLGYYLYFFFGVIVWNSFIEELSSRAYPIEKLKTHMNPYVIFVIMAIIFTIPHFVLHKFSVGYCIGLFSLSIVYSLLYYYSKSIWTVVGMHSGTNWFGFSFSGTNWKLGALCKVEIALVPDWIQYCITLALALSFLILIQVLYKRGFFLRMNH